MEARPDVLNHNTETVPRLYRQVRLGARYERSLDVLQHAPSAAPATPTKSGLMLGLGETAEEVLQVMRDLRAHDVDILTLGQYLRPSPKHLPIVRYVTPEEFDEFRRAGQEMGFAHVESGSAGAELVSCVGRGDGVIGQWPCRPRIPGTSGRGVPRKSPSSFRTRPKLTLFRSVRQCGTTRQRCRSRPCCVSPPLSSRAQRLCPERDGAHFWPQLRVASEIKRWKSA